MQIKSFDVPNLYGDHHVLEVRRLLFDIPGVQDVYASSAFRTVEVSYDESQTSAEELQLKLEAAGYLGEWLMPVEIGATPPAGENGKRAFFRHSESYEATRQVVSFSQVVKDTTRPLWPCPGFGLIKKMED